MSEYKKDDIVRGKVTGIEEYGFFISLEDGTTGLVHISEMSNAFVRDISDYVDMDEEIEAKVLEVDSVNKKLKLSIKDIDYRIHHKKRVGIVETKSGFESLHKALDKWIDEKEEEMVKNQKKV